MALFCVNLLTLSGRILNFQQVPKMSRYWGIWVSKVKVTRRSWSKAPSSYTWIKVAVPAKAGVKCGLKDVKNGTRRAQYIVLHQFLLFLFLSSKLRQAQGHIHSLSATCWSWSVGIEPVSPVTSEPHSDLYCLTAPTSNKLHTQQSILVPLCCRLSL